MAYTSETMYEGIRTLQGGHHDRLGRRGGTVWLSRTGARPRTVGRQALDEVVTFTSDLIRIDTTNRGGGDCQERPAAEYVAERLAEAGLEPDAPGAHPGPHERRRPHRGHRPVRRRAARPRSPGRGARRGRRLERAPLLRGDPRRGRVGPRRRRHEEHGRDDPRRRARLGPRRACGPGATSSSPSPPTRRPAPRTAPASSPTSTPGSSRAAPRASASPGPSPSTTAAAGSSTRSRPASAAPAGSS